MQHPCGGGGEAEGGVAQICAYGIGDHLQILVKYACRFRPPFDSSGVYNFQFAHHGVQEKYSQIRF